MRQLIITGVLISSIGVNAFGQGAQANLETYLSNAFPTGLVASASQDKVAWVRNSKGVRNIWIAVAPDFKGGKVTDYKVDDGRDISNLQFLTDEDKLVYVHGNSPNRKGEFPNPAILPDGNFREIKLLDLSTAVSTKLADGFAPVVSPVKNEMVYLSKGQIWYQDVSQESDPSQLITIRGNASQLSWSHDGTKLAFVSGRGDHSFVGVYDFSARAIRYLDPSVDQDNSPVWSPDGNSIAFVRTSNERNRLIFEPHRSGLPWSIVVADVNTGKGNELWKADEGAGSVFRQISAQSQIFWGKGNFIVFPWEKYGWTNLFSISADSKKLTRLTNGEFEIQYVSISPDGSEIYYSSNQNDIDRQHIWKSSVAGGAATQLTTGQGVEWNPVALKNGQVGCLSSRYDHPAFAAIWQNSKSRTLVEEPIPSNYPVKQLTQPEQVIFNSADGIKIHGQLFKPKNYDSKRKYPAVLFFHGGSRRQIAAFFPSPGVLSQCILTKSVYGE